MSIPPTTKTQQQNRTQAVDWCHAELGWSFTPLSGKRPLLPGWQKADRETREQATAWAEAGNIGLRTGQASGVVVIDVDDGGSVDAFDLPATVTATTGSGGRHYYFRAPDQRIGNSAGKLADHVDIRGDGGQVVFPGSVHPDSGREYQFDAGAEPWTRSLADLPANVIEAIEGDRNKGQRRPSSASTEWRPTSTHAGASHDMQERERRCMAYIEKCPEAISGNGGHDTTLRAACECYRFGLNESAAWHVMQWFNDTRTGGERWSTEELEHKLNDAQRKVDLAGECGMRLNETTNAVVPDPLRPHALTTDTGNAARLVRRHGDQIRYCPPTGKWLAWDRRRWKVDDRGQIMELCKKAALAIVDEAKQAQDIQQHNELLKHAMASLKRERLNAMAALAQSSPGVVVTPDELDADPWAFNVRNGTIDLRTGELRPHRQADLITKLAPVEYDASAKCPRFDRFLQQTFCGDADLIQFVQRWHGHCLTGDISEQYLPIYHGGGNNGKSILIDTLCAVMGDYAGTAAPGLLTAQKHEQHPTEIADLKGKRFVHASETERGAELKLQLVKRLTGDAILKGRFMRQDFFEFARTCKLILVTNNKPTIKEDTEAAWRRLRLVPFSNTVPKEERDRGLMRKLAGEWAGILAWMVRGCLDWQREGLNEPDAVVMATEAYRGIPNSLDGFIRDHCTLGAGLACLTAGLTSNYEKWCTINREIPLQGKALGAVLKAKQCERKRIRGRWHWLGIDLDSSPTGHNGQNGHDFPIDPLISDS